MLRSPWNKSLAALSIGGLLLAAVCARAGSPPAPSRAAPDPGKLIVHEWGTFLSVQGSDGVALGGMIESEEKLPSFVRERSLDGRNRACLFLKMETPVTYFYVDRPRSVQVRVAMNQGLLTHWFPAVQSFGPAPLKCKASSPNSFLDWGTVELTPDTRSAVVGPHLPVPGLRNVDRGDTWGFVRDTDAALVRVAPRNRPVVVRQPGEAEKFLFYRGLGSYPLPLQADFVTVAQRRVPDLTIHNRGKDALQGIFLIQVEHGAIHFEALPNLAGGALNSLGPNYVERPTTPLAEGVPQVKKAVATALVKAGLYPKEAQAMVNNWEKSYFWTEGLRILYVLPRSRVDEIIPLQINPSPDQLVRVMVGRLEVLTPDKEQKLEEAVAALHSANPGVRKAAGIELARLGRLREPALRRIAGKTTDPLVRSQAESLIAGIAGGK